MTLPALGAGAWQPVVEVVAAFQRVCKPAGFPRYPFGRIDCNMPIDAKTPDEEEK